MHYKIYQLTREKLDEENWISVSDFEEDCPNSDMDYVGSIKPEWRDGLIDELAQHVLPNGCFERIGENEIRYIGGLEKWIADWMDKISKKALALKGKNSHYLLCHGYELRFAMSQPTETASKIYVDDGYYVGIGRWVAEESWQLQPGDILYVGGIVDYHI